MNQSLEGHCPSELTLPYKGTPFTVLKRKEAEHFVSQAIEVLRREFAAKGKEALFDCIREQLTATGERCVSRTETARQLGLKPATVRLIVHRTRRTLLQRVQEKYCVPS